MFKFLRKQPAIGTIEIVPVQEGHRVRYSPRIFMAIFSFHKPRWTTIHPLPAEGHYFVYCGSDRPFLFDDPQTAFTALMDAWDSHCRVASYIEKPDLPVRR